MNSSVALGRSDRIGDQLRLLVGVLGEELHGARDGVAGGVVAGEHDQEPRTVEVFVGQVAAVDLGAGDGGHHVFLRVIAALLQHVQAVVEHLRDVLVEGLDELHQLQRRLGDLGAVRGQALRQLQVVHPVQELRPIGLRHAQDLAQGEERQAGGDRLHEIALAAVGLDAVQEPRAFLRHPFPQGVEVAGREERHVLLAKLQMPRRVHVDHGVHRGAEEERMPRLGRPGRHQDAALLGAEGGGVAVHPRHVLVAGDRPEAGLPRVELGLPGDGRLLAEAGVGGERVAVHEGAGVAQGAGLDLGIDLGMGGGRAGGGHHRLAQEVHGSSPRSPRLMRGSLEAHYARAARPDNGAATSTPGLALVRARR